MCGSDSIAIHVLLAGSLAIPIFEALNRSHGTETRPRRFNSRAAQLRPHSRVVEHHLNRARELSLDSSASLAGVFQHDEGFQRVRATSDPPSRCKSCYCKGHVTFCRYSPPFAVDLQHVGARRRAASEYLRPIP
jgi:hypothetical protein